MPRRSRLSHGYLISARLGDAMAPHIAMVWCATYVTMTGGGRQLRKIRMLRAEQRSENIDRFAGWLDDLYTEIDDGRGVEWDHANQRRPEMYGLGCVVDASRNSAFRKVLLDHRFGPEITQTLNNDRLDDWSPNRLDTLTGRAFLINDLASEMAARRVAIEAEGSIPVSDIAEALEGAQQRPTARHQDTTVVVETDYRDDVALCTALGVFWSHYRPPVSENWLLFETEGGQVLVPYSGAIV